ncbi:hypothetical protein DAPPUDRAFT_109985 [Daphnia pulex]|uniref:CUB domain-containing protein n=1 Tax=Daphnia pulex TaxID=6669 RepID=E9H4U1_DAPPU|nr:hypothetical protein DAPPUDRAFT_109985 [Daphnia pulex]|eukprot:EFX73296.1 hypothetical protein DAPPUDRAFT_109985 [Daphnia pulex]
MKSLSIFFFLVSLAVAAAEAQSAKQRSSSKSDNPSTSRNLAAILKAEMAIRSIPSSGKACLDRFSMGANGTIRPTISNSSNGQKQCSFFINAPANKLIQMTCSVVRLNSSGAELAIYGGAEINVNPPAVNRIYTSRSDSMFLFFKVDNTDWFDCKWKMIPVPQTTEYQLCRDGTSAAPNGTIQRSADDTSSDARMCMFAITVPSDHRIQLKCSNVTLSSPDNYLQFQTVSETVIADPPVTNRVYTSTSEIIYLFSQFSNQDSFKCQWMTVMIPALPTDNKLCREKITKSASGNIQPLMPMANGTNVQPNSCSFIIEVPPNQLTEISCPVVNFTSPGSYLHFSGISDLNMALSPLANRVYTSGVDLIYLNSQIDVSKDWFNCSWKAVPAPSTPDFKLCRHGGTTSSSGTLQPFLDGLTTGEPRECYFFIDVPLNEEIEILCSSINLSSPGSYLRVVGVSDFDENPPVENGIYLSNGRSVLVYSQFNNGDWFDCMWAPTTCPAPSTTTIPSPTTSKTMAVTSSPSTLSTTQSTTQKTTITTPLPANHSCAVYDSVTSTGGVVQTLNFPGDYDAESSRCGAFIEVSAGRGIQLTFTDFNLAPGDFLSVSDADNIMIMQHTAGKQFISIHDADVLVACLLQQEIASGVLRHADRMHSVASTKATVIELLYGGRQLGGFKLGIGAGIVNPPRMERKKR